MWQKIKEKLKGAWRSFTIWFNVIALASVQYVDQLKDLVPQLENYLDDKVYKKAMLFLIIAGNVLLRFKTNKDLADKANNNAGNS